MEEIQYSIDGLYFETFEDGVLISRYYVDGDSKGELQLFHDNSNIMICYQLDEETHEPTGDIKYYREDGTLLVSYRLNDAGKIDGIATYYDIKGEYIIHTAYFISGACVWFKDLDGNII